MGNIEFGWRSLVAVLAIVGTLIVYRTHHAGTSFAADGTDAAWDAAAGRDDGVRRPAVVLFTAGWCPSCRMLHDNTLARSDVQEELRGHYRFLKVDLTSPTPAAQAHAEKAGVHAIPTMIRYDADGRETDRTHYLDPQRMIEWLKQGE